MTRVYVRSAGVAQPRSRTDGMEKRLLQEAEAGDAGSQCNLGIIYANGLDDNGYAVRGYKPQAVRWLSAAAEQGLPRAQLKLAEVYAEAAGASRAGLNKMIRHRRQAMKGWFVPPIVIPVLIVFSLVGYASYRVFL